MASTPSPILRIQLMGTGDQAGTWGDTTNTNLGTLLEGAIAGLSSVSVTSANQAFTVSDYVTDQARMAIISLSTTTAANFNVYAPPVSKTYIIYNTSAYSATIYNSTVAGNTTAAGSGVTIPAGKTTQVWSTGTNFFKSDTAISLSTDVTGTLPVANGGTGITSFGTGVATALGQNVTGSGGIVLAASPTMTGSPIAPTQVYGTNNTTIATTAFVQAALQALHPVGSIYINATNSTNPGTLLGFGTWVAFGAGRVPVGFDSTNTLFDSAEETGGSANAIVVSHTHTGTTSTIGDHQHGVPGNYIGSGITSNGGYLGGADTTTTSTTAAGSHNHTFTTDSSGSSGTNANYQPYITVYMWKRTA